MDIYELVEVLDCPQCGGPAYLEEECKNSFYVMCVDCGARTVNIDYKTEEGRLDAAKRAAEVWNRGKAISSHPGE